MTTTQTQTQSNRLTWPRYRRDDGTPIVGWTCDNCGHEVEAPYDSSRLARCPNCGGNQHGVRGWTVEALVENRRLRLLEQLARHWDLEPIVAKETGIATCAICGTDEDVSTCPGETFDDLQFRCSEHRRVPEFWWQPGNHPSMLVRRWIETCDECGAEFTGLFGVTYWFEQPGQRCGVPDHTTKDVCLRCVDPGLALHYLERDRA